MAGTATELNPTECIWEQLKQRLGEYPDPPRGILELWERMEKEGEGVPSSRCRDLVESMPRRVEAVIRAKGDCTKYQFCVDSGAEFTRCKTVQVQSSD